MANVQLNYYNGNSYEVLYPQVNLSNVIGTLSSSYLPSSINATTINGYSYSSILSNSLTQTNNLICQASLITGSGSSSTTITLNSNFGTPYFAMVINNTNGLLMFLKGLFSNAGIYIVNGKIEKQLSVKMTSSQLQWTDSIMNSASINYTVYAFCSHI